MRTKLFERANRNSKSAKRSAIAMAAVVSSIGIGLLGAAPAQASTVPEFFIYYSPNCTNAYRFYLGANSGENWINDRFNEGSGSPGYNELIAYNAASVWVAAGTWVQIDYDNAYQSFFIQKSSTARCVNLSPATRNDNYDWADGD